jgi:hypothetical protein
LTHLRQVEPEAWHPAAHQPEEEPMQRITTIGWLGLTLLSAACATDSPTAGGGPDDGNYWIRNNGAGQAGFMTRNLYVGADVDAVIGALASSDPSDDLPALLTALGELAATDWPARARAIAAEIARERPHAVGLQEVSTVDVDLSGFGIPAYHADFLPTLLSELSALGLNYTVAAQVQNTVAQPMPGVGLIDQDALLIDADRVTLAGAPFGKTFTYNIGQVAPGVTIVRGFVRVDAVIGGQPWTIISTHLESGGQEGLDQLRAAQMQEVAAYLPPSGPAVVLGDLNDDPGSPMYQVAMGAGLTDVWAAVHPSEPGYTCCHASDLSDTRPELDQRIDYVLSRGTAPGDDGEFGRIRLIGMRQSDRIAGPDHPIWPSDHAGLSATLRAPRPTALR